MREFPNPIKVFRALGDPKRALIVEMLSCGELCACKILEKFSMSQSTLSHHMRLLCECGLVKCRNVGKWTFYSLDQNTIDHTSQFLLQITSDNESCICKEGNPCRGSLRK